MYKNKVILRKREVIPPLTYSMIPVNFFQNNASIINFTTNDMTSKFEFFLKNNINNLYLAEIMLTDWLQMLDEYCDERDTFYSDDFDFWPDCFINIIMNRRWMKPMKFLI